MLTLRTGSDAGVAASTAALNRLLVRQFDAVVVTSSYARGEFSRARRQGRARRPTRSRSGSTSRPSSPAAGPPAPTDRAPLAGARRPAVAREEPAPRRRDRGRAAPARRTPPARRVRRGPAPRRAGAAGRAAHPSSSTATSPAATTERPDRRAPTWRSRSARPRPSGSPCSRRSRQGRRSSPPTSAARASWSTRPAATGRPRSRRPWPTRCCEVAARPRASQPGRCPAPGRGVPVVALGRGDARRSRRERGARPSGVPGLSDRAVRRSAPPGPPRRGSRSVRRAGWSRAGATMPSSRAASRTASSPGRPQRQAARNGSAHSRYHPCTAGLSSTTARVSSAIRRTTSA